MTGDTEAGAPGGPSGAVSLRPARTTDAGAVAALVAALGYPTDGAAMAERLDSIAAERDYVTLVAERSGFVVGVAGVRVGPLYEKTGRYGQLMLLAVTESAQGTGVGRALMAAVEELVRERGGIEMVVHSGDQRPAAHTFYRRAGYRDTGRRFIKPLVPARA